MYDDCNVIFRIFLQGFLRNENHIETIIGYLQSELGHNKILDVKFWTLTDGEDIAELSVLAMDDTYENEMLIRDRVNRRMDMQNISKCHIDIINNAQLTENTCC